MPIPFSSRHTVEPLRFRKFSIISVDQYAGTCAVAGGESTTTAASVKRRMFPPWWPCPAREGVGGGEVSPRRVPQGRNMCRPLPARSCVLPSACGPGLLRFYFPYYKINKYND